MTECRLGCGRDIEFVKIEKKDGTRKSHPIDSPPVKVPEGRVVWDDDLRCYRILDARLKKDPDGTITVRAGQAWPVDGGAYRSHMDTCTVLAQRVMTEKRRAKPRNEQEEIEREVEEASSHIQRCRVCHWPMDEALSADHAWTTHPACDPANRLPDLAEANRLTGRHDLRAQDVAVPVVEIVARQHEAAEQGKADRLRRAQETVDTEWTQGRFAVLDEEEAP
jgi:hypothetical protein